MLVKCQQDFGIKYTTNTKKNFSFLSVRSTIYTFYMQVNNILNKIKSPHYTLDY